MIRLVLAARLCRSAAFACATLVGALTAPALAAPCGKTQDAIAIAVCTRPDLRDRDAQRERLITDARMRRGMPENRIIGRLAHTWDEDRRELCPTADPVCLRLIYNDQIAFWSRIDGTPGHSDRLRFVQFRHERPAGKPGQGSFVAEFDGFVFATPTSGAQRQFNHDIEAAIADLRKAVTDDGDPTLRSDVEAYARTTLHAPTWTGRLLSVRLTNDTFTGGAHGLQATWNLNLDAEAERKLRLTDLFSDRTLAGITSACARQVATDTSQDGFDTRKDLFGPGGHGVSKSFAALAHRANRWSLTGHRIRMTIPEYTLGGMGLGEPTCEISAGDLAALGGCVDRSEF